MQKKTTIKFTQKHPIISELETIFVIKRFSVKSPEKYLTYAVCAKNEASQSEILCKLLPKTKINVFATEVINTGIKPYLNCVNDKQFEFSKF